MDKFTHPYFVPETLEGSRAETATMLVGTITEFGSSPEVDNMGNPVDGQTPLTQADVTSVQGGFRISQSLYEALGWDDEDETPEQFGVTETRQTPGVNVEETEVDPEEAEDDVPTEDEADEVEPYENWDRPDLLAEVSRRGIKTDDKKNPTLVAALEADDERVAAENENDADAAESEAPTDPPADDDTF